MCSHVIGAVAVAHPDAAHAQKHYLIHALAMCQDTDLAVRRSMCAQLRPIARAIGSELASGALLTELMELLRDEDREVRAAAFVCGVELFTFCVPEQRSALLQPALSETVLACVTTLEAPADAAPAGHAPPEVIERVAEKVAELLAALAATGTLDELAGASVADASDSLFVRILQQLATSKAEPEWRRHCAAALPAAAYALGGHFLQVRLR